ncbi:MAG TPA: 4a-hydroxytetrahydrobiopterin dehydratase [Actinomycetota bacterium]|jgi:4a-hydroxytetrahydrobiopterin dehydratase|nr:4a-hydroxytetrahydrobiopterin dehydratase [Actinomycetota bacterium]
MELLDDSAIETALKELPGWRRDGNEIVKTFQFDGFGSAMTFVGRVAEAAEAADHHPDIDIRWNKVKLALSTHSAGGLTERDTTLAHRIEHLGGEQQHHPPGPAGTGTG